MKNSDLSTYSQRLHTKDYHTQFNTEAYLSGYMFYEMIPSFDRLLKETVRIFNENEQRLGHKCALEFGGGPALFSSFLLAQYVESIHFTDYTPSNLKAVEDWINQSDNAHDWTDLFEHIIQENQCQESDKTGTVADWEMRLRNALLKGGLSLCGDINKQFCPILDDKINANQYDIVLSSLCLEDACLSLVTYQMAVKRLYAVLKPGGFIFLTHGRNQTFYYVIDKQFFALPLNEEKTHEALKVAGFIDIHVIGLEKPPTNAADADGFLIAYGYKPGVIDN